ncbi:substrate-binding domain-containing protein [Rhodospirillales bacterium]|nr:substrate-binding domain-containing protein [Rhodospirillales bacterium]
MYRKFIGIAVVAGIAVAGSAAEARDQIRVVGSSTVYPFATVVAEQFGKTSQFKTPVIESTGSGGGLKLFCSGVGVEHPDITNASRRIKQSEIDKCAKNGVNDIIEIKVGYDGIVLANAKTAPVMNITKQQIFLALAKNIPDGKGGLKENDNMKWSDIDPSLPVSKIEVLGPPPTSGTRDAFAELALEGGCKTFKKIKAIKKTDKKKYKAVCHGVREDGGYVEAGENDVLIVRKLEANPAAFGVFGFSFLDQNADKVQGSLIENVGPTFDAIAVGSYPVSRSLYFYVKVAHVGKVPGIKEFVSTFTSEQMSGPDGVLSERGLIPMPDAERTKFRKDAEMMSNNITM